MQTACSCQSQGYTLHSPLNVSVVAGLHTLDTSLTILKGRVNENKKIMQQTKEEEWKIHQAFLVSVISVTSTDA